MTAQTRPGPKGGDIPALTKRCTASGRPLRPGETYHSVLVEIDGQWIRQDYAAENWTGPPPGTIAHWVGTVPPPPADAHASQPVTDLTMLLRLLESPPDTGRQAESEQLRRYVAALILLQQRRLRLVRTDPADNGATRWICRDPASGHRYEVVDPGYPPEVLQQAYQELSQWAADHSPPDDRTS